MRNIINIDQKWAFIKDLATVPGEIPETAEQVDLPHSWNAVDGQDGGNDYFRGTCCYLKQVSELTGAPLEELKNLNPQYRHEIIPGNEREYILRLPYNYTNAFIDCEDSLYRYKADVYFNPTTLKKLKDGGDGERIVYRVQNGDYLGRIATKYRVSVNQIKRWNGLKSNNIRVGQRLIIYRGGKAPASTSSSSAAKSASTQTTAAKPVLSASGDYVIYTVQSGDSFYQIAKQYPGVSAQNIMDYNGIDSSKLRPGMKIKIPVIK